MQTLTPFRPLLALAGLALTVAMPARAADLTVTAFGGIWEKSLRTCYVEPFQKKTGKTVDVVLGTPAQWVNQVAANPAKPPIDVFLTLIDGAEDAKARGLVEKIDPAKVPNLADVPEPLKQVVGGDAVVLHFGAAGLAYNEAKIKNPPKSWAEFIDRTLKGEWQAALPGINVASTTPTAVIWNFNDALGGKVGDISPVIAKMKALRDSGNVIFWNDVNQFLTQMQSGEADIGIYWDGRAWAARDGGFKALNFYYPAPGGVVSPTVVQKVKNGSPAAWEFIDFLFSPEPQSCWAAAIQYPVASTKAQYKPEQKARMPKLDDVRWPPFAEILAAMPKWVETWNKEIGR
ncbi:MAG: extracellular solute-binding protein [Bosea sp.]|uniref:extracellular solute-binding protein n=1 Tax=unclassified Bosea (in: a-proteobacteria) TaxID=2653178 RepID=UPI000962C8C5|nr:MULTISPECIES: extracellular solute-binding protein [unclassified Bosea (in: a-proteobacteria)]MBN9458225.1 extracellular solute-binding protein [Bosea sp. (in: a-proteobacteria)]OJV07034.1 MAG: ABC transporter substrate-binding protein [Bosea sp. 67-29]